jgi:hypothetical protein
MVEGEREMMRNRLELLRGAATTGRQDVVEAVGVHPLPARVDGDQFPAIALH